MSRMEFVLVVAAALIGLFALVRLVLKRGSGGSYQRHFNHVPANDDAAFPISSTMYLGDGGSSSHAHHHHHAADCGHHSDSSASCSDGGGTH